MTPQQRETPPPAGGASPRSDSRSLGSQGQGLPAQLEPLQLLSRVSRDLKSLTSTDWSALVAANSKEAIRLLEQIARTTTAVQADVLAATEASGMWALDGQKNFNTWITNQTGTTRGTAGKAVRLSKSLQGDLPATRKALAEGEISSDHAQIIARRCTKTNKHKEKLADPERGEAFLLEQAKQMDATKFAKVAKSWAIETDPKAADRQWRKESAKEEVTLVSSEDGYFLSGRLNSVSGAILDEALRAHMGRKAADDLRTYDERRADALTALASQSLDAGFQMPNARIRPHLTVTVEYDTLRRLVQASGPLMPAAAPNGEAFGIDDSVSEHDWANSWTPGDDHLISTSLDYTHLEGATPAELPDGTPIPHRVLARLACESMFARVVFGPDSTVLNVGREQRIFTANQTRAIIARDRSCRYPDCEEPPGFGEIHHSISWAKHQGNTDVDLGVLLCYHHHDLVHERDISITRRRGAWIFTNRHGRTLTPLGHASAQTTGPVSSTRGESPPATSSPGINVPAEDLDPSQHPPGSRRPRTDRESRRPDSSSRPPARAQRDPSRKESTSGQLW